MVGADLGTDVASLQRNLPRRRCHSFPRTTLLLLAATAPRCAALAWARPLRWAARHDAATASGASGAAAGRAQAPLEAQVETERRTLSTRFTERLARGWLWDMAAKKRLDVGWQRLRALQPNSCAATGLEEGTSSCADVLSWRATNVTWYGAGGADDGDARLRLSACDAEFVNLHRRILSRGRLGSARATLTLRGSDVDASLWIRRALENVLRMVLTKMGFDEDTDFAFQTSVLKDGRVRLDGATGDGTKFSASFRLQPDGGAVALREALVWIEGKSVLNLRHFSASLPVPTPLVENFGSLYLSSVYLDTADAFIITNIKKAEDSDALRLSVVASPAAFRAAHRSARRKNLEPLGGRVRALRSGERVRVQASPSPPGSEWGFSPAHMFASIFARGVGSSVQPLRHTFYLGERLPWLLNPGVEPPGSVVWALATLSFALKVAHFPDDAWRFARRLSSDTAASAARKTEASTQATLRGAVRFANFAVRFTDSAHRLARSFLRRISTSWAAAGSGSEDMLLTSIRRPGQ
ncbi:hypothetical protein M885DRAFT_524592 [Pelagophyceae sp. CCMP2097]|nr:hypothetical protein M885DRAFT_524592 [Pelagophyceae sp. CCMP2097]